MSTTTSVTGSSGVAYATELAQTSKLKRFLSDLGSSIERGDLSSAGATLTAIKKAFPEYVTAATSANVSSASTQTAQTGINGDFSAISDAITSGNAEAAKSAWTQLKSDLAKSGIKNLKTSTAELLTSAKASVDRTLLTSLFGSDSANDSLATLLGGGSSTASTSSMLSELVARWQTYKATGETAPAANTTPTRTLDTSA